ncbi:Arylsulfatase A [Tistlia consotensis]|uniref:Arylsulfatase A n=1 Tax=Tistlia consotensis USBA 355 TaxID=560819 RepID=A0A1Y6CMG3_9PROT|nr:alkaline phosphatase family protein [Tistlia consotensis]SMF77763.1 Arylsulfatase A [Tistlia consotensis USBA 355]SNS20635.1 Arylsulfatase A [Tistlia consotensis]
MTGERNVLWIMCDQLRFDYLGCTGHPHLETPNIDALAARGVRFERAYVQSPICGPSRMSFYTGRYVRSHGSSWNKVPLRVGEPTLGDHLAELGVRNVLVGKTHMKADLAGMARLGIDPASDLGVRIAQCGFEPFERDDGLHPDGPYDPDPPYDRWLRALGYQGDNPWEDWANSAEGPDGELLSGWLLEHADKPARVKAEHSETAYMTDRAMAFIEQAGADERPWCLHLSYIKPHWPYIAPAPYHALYDARHVLPVVRDEAERRDPHPVYARYLEERFSRAFARQGVRERVIPAYMGLIRQIDDELGRLFAFLKRRGLWERTLIVFTSDHGDYLGDHWLGEKELFHECSVRIPLIVVDPSPAADATRGSVSDRLVESIDLAPTFLEFFGGAAKPHVLEGRSLLPLLRDDGSAPARPFVVSEYDYAMRRARTDLGVPISDARLWMVFDGRWKYVHARGFRPLLFDLESDPDEFRDLGADPAFADQRARLHACLSDWALQGASRITLSDAEIARATDREVPAGILIGYWDEEEVAEARRLGSGVPL